MSHQNANINLLIFAAAASGTMAQQSIGCTVQSLRHRFARFCLKRPPKAAVTASFRTGTYKARGSFLIDYGADKLGSAKLLDNQ
jgi:hypothetical protein